MSDTVNVTLPEILVVMQGPKGETKDAFYIDLRGDVDDLVETALKDAFGRWIGSQRRKGMEIPESIVAADYDWASGMSEEQKNVRAAVRRLVALGVPEHDAKKIVRETVERLADNSKEDN